MPTRPLDFRLRRERIALALDQHHLCHKSFAKELKVSRQYWSLLFNSRRPVSPRIRARLLASPRLTGVPESELWEIRPSTNTGDA